MMYLVKTFGEALKALKNGLMVRRTSWHSCHFVFRQVPSQISQEIVPKMQSLPDSVKNEFARRFESPDFQIDSIYYDNQLALVNQSNLIQSYSPSIEDCQAEDWAIYDPTTN